MIWNEELSASLDQSAGVVVFHRIDLSRTQQLALTVAEKVNALVEQSEKSLDLKLGGTGGWGDRADGKKGENRGEQAQGERRGRGERTRGTRGELGRLSNLFNPNTSWQVVLVVAEGHDSHKGWAIKCLVIFLKEHDLLYHSLLYFAFYEYFRLSCKFECQFIQFNNIRKHLTSKIGHRMTKFT